MLSDFDKYAAGLAGFFKQKPVSPTHWEEEILEKDGMLRAQSTIASWDGYQPTQLHSLVGLASRLDVQAVYLKDESTRFGLGTFKALGGGYAIDCLFRGERLKKGDIVTCATDGNHGRGVAWAANMRGLDSIIYIPAHVSQNRESYIRNLGATVVRVHGSYEDALEKCTLDSQYNGWTLISDTATEADTKVPTLIMNSYTMVAKEIVDNLSEPPTHVFVPAGVGGLASAVTEYMRQAYLRECPQIIAVEPEAAACLHDSFQAGKLSQARGDLQTFMGCLACGRPATISWEILKRYGAGAISVKDFAAMNAQRDLANGAWGDPSIEGGESGIAALTGFLCTASANKARQAFKIDNKSKVVVLMTEGPTDHGIFHENVGRAPHISYG